MLYYADRRYTITENTNGTYDVYDAKYGKKGTRRNQSKEWADNFIQQRHGKEQPRPCFLQERRSQWINMLK